MSGDVKTAAPTTHPGANSRRRQLGATSSRRRCDSLRQGYGTTTMAAIAAEAGVAAQDGLPRLRDQERAPARALESAPARRRGRVPVAERDWYREALEEPDPERSSG